MITRSCGTLLHITSLPSPYGIGTMGAEAKRFADFLSETGQGYWQVLPINPTGYADSPYQSFSTYAGNPYLIDLDLLCEQGYLKKEEYINLNWGEDPKRVDYGKQFENKFAVLKIAAQRAKKTEIKGLSEFCDQNGWWLYDYAVFMTAKNANNLHEWTAWEDQNLRYHEREAVDAFAQEHEDEVFFWKFIQFVFEKQWRDFKEYANNVGVKIIGDIPIYVSGDSADAWAARYNFCYDENCVQTLHAGVPPDYFCEDGQFWGNPIYNWDKMREDGYEWWIGRLRYLSGLYDVIRIDHFRGFEAFYAIDQGEKTARNGKWLNGPCSGFFDVVKNRLGDFPIIAEDLGFLTEGVHQMRRNAGYPGMKVLEFAFDASGTSDYLPHRYDYNCVVYTGTHDNSTLLGWLNEADEQTLEFVKNYCALTEEEGYVWGILRTGHASVANLFVAQMQDYLELAETARMNEPSTVGKNWCWRMLAGYDKKEFIEKIKRMVKLYGRNNV